MENQRRQAITIGVIMGAILILCLFLVFYLNKWYFKIIPLIPAGIIIAIFIRMFLLYKRRKLVFTGKVLTISKPTGKVLPKWTVIMKEGNVSKKLFSLEEPKMKIGKIYSVAYEEKSNNILMVEEVTFQAIKQVVGKNAAKGMGNMKFKR